MACISKHYNRKHTQRFHRTGPLDDSDFTRVGMEVRSEMVDNQDDEISNGNQGDDAGVFERVKPPQKAQWNNQEHKGCDPKVTVDEVRKLLSMTVESANYAGHQVTDNDHIGDSDSKALDGDSQIEQDRCVRIGDLGQGEEGRSPPIEVSRALGL